MRNVEEVFSALKENHGPDSRQSAGWHSAFHRRWAGGAGLRGGAAVPGHRTRRHPGPARAGYLRLARRCWARSCARLSMRAHPWRRWRFAPRREGAFRCRLTLFTTNRQARDRGSVRWSRCTTWSRSRRSSRSWSCRGAWRPSAGSPAALAMRSRTPSTPSWCIWNC